MLEKATLRIPAPLLARLRERSRQEGRSLNETALRAIESGLGGDVSNEGWTALGTVLETPPSAAYDPDRIQDLQAKLGPGARRLQDDLDWVRDEE